MNSPCAEGHKAQRRELEELFSEGDSDYGDAPDTAADKCSQRDFPTKNYYPEDIEKGAAEAGLFIGDFFLKRESAEPGNFKALDSGGNSDYAYAEEQSRKGPFQPEDKSAEDEPEDISQSFHLIKPFYVKNDFLFAKFVTL